ncbi:MAG: T9SS C-terminal target domain-containing protein [Bacteroidetes bacterium]|nr:MAG: T9SS C-terminal target domain-containing protein [Bacteroidota bacterium]MBL1145908.1 T9SS C-terminal target domain-containing protein [Bacteroidota bacterium]NOG58702.1 T9SS type A sorting domain-containing protein [Bacteroidota bacterium]
MKIKTTITAILGILFLNVNAQQYHVNESFNGGTLPSGWTTNAITGTHVWSFGIDGSIDHAGNNNIDGTAMAYFDDGQYTGSSINDYAELISPAFNNVTNANTTIEFDYNFRQYGPANDSFIVEVFDGTTWVQVFSKTTDDCGSYISSLCHGNFPKASINISQYANANCRVKFKYFDGNNWSWYVGLDNVKVTSPLPYDAGVSRIIRPITSCGLTATDTIELVINNYGANAINNFSVSYALNGNSPISETISKSLNAGDSMTYKFANTANLSAIGTYNLTAFTNLSTDGNNQNDTSKTQIQNTLLMGLPYIESFETGTGGWFTYGQNSSWARGIPNGNSINGTTNGQNAWITNLNGVYNGQEISYLESPCLDLSTSVGDPILTFSLYYLTETPYDYAWMEYSLDNGITWAKLLAGGAFPKNWYNNTSVGNWSGNSNGWLNVENVLTGLGGQSKVRLRMAFKSDGSTHLEGIGFDYITIWEPQANDLSVNSIIRPAVGYQGLCGYGLETIEIQIENKGANPIVNPIMAYSVDQATAITETFMTTIASNTTQNFSFTTPYNFSALKNYNLKVWGTATNDIYNVNDTMVSLVQNTNVSLSLLPLKENWEHDIKSASALNTSVNGWVQTNPNNIVTWRVNAGPTSSTATGPDFDHTTGTATGKYLYIETSTSMSTVPAELESPCISLAGANNPELTFWYHMHGATIGTLSVDIYDGITWVNNVDSITGQQQISTSSSWLQKNVNLIAFAGKRIKIRFRASRTTSFTGDIAIDDIVINNPISQDAELSAFLAPGNPCGLTSTSLLSITVGNSGTAAIAANAIQVNYQIDNRPIVSETLAVALAIGVSTNYNFIGTADLSIPNRTYKIKIWTSLAGDSNHGNDTLIKFLINQTKTPGFVDDFESFTDGNCNSATGDIYTGGWYVNQTTGFGWQIQNAANCSGGSGSSTPTSNTGPAGDHTNGNGNFLFTESSSTGGPAVLVLPCINLTNVASARLGFWYHKYGAQMGDLYVDVQNGAGVWVNNIDYILGETHSSPIDPWKYKQVRLGQFVGQEISLRFRAVRGNGSEGDMAIDDISIFLPPQFDLETKLSSLQSYKSTYSGCSLSSNELVGIDIENVGYSTVSGKIYIGYQLNNDPAIIDSLNSISIIPGATLNYTFNNNRVNLSNPGIYNFKFWVKAVGDTSVVNDTTFYKVIIETQATPYCENFDSLVEIANTSGQDVIDGKFSNYWKTNKVGYSWMLSDGNAAPGPFADASSSGTGKYFVAYELAFEPVHLLSSPCIDLTSAASSNLVFAYHQNMSGTLFIDVYDGTNWILGVDSIVGNTNPTLTSAWGNKTVNLSSFVGNYITLRFRLKAVNSAAKYAAIDNVCVNSVLVGIEVPNSRNNITIYPNPSTGVFNVAFSSLMQNAQLEVRDIQGKIVFYKNALKSTNYQLDLSNQSKGVYFIQVKSEVGVFKEKIIVQ